MASNGPSAAPRCGILGDQLHQGRGLQAFGSLANIPHVLRPGLLQAAIAKASRGVGSSIVRAVAPPFGGSEASLPADTSGHTTPSPVAPGKMKKIEPKSGQPIWPAWVPTETSRSLAPVRREYKRGSAEIADTLAQDPDQLIQAQLSYEGAKMAKSSLGPQASRLRWWEIRAAKHCMDPFPLDLRKVRLIGTLLFAGGYRSAGLYLSTIKKEHVKRGHDWSQALALEATEANRAFDRGKGPNKQSGHIDIDAAIKSGGFTAVWPPSVHGPALPFHALAVSTFWLMREVELSTAQLGSITLVEGVGCGVAHVNLPVSKGDVHALGKVRSHCCCCSTTDSCPVWALKRLYEDALDRAGGHANLCWRDAPLCPTSAGGYPTKEGVVDCCEVIGDRYGKIGGKLTGHLGRIGGAIRMALAGLELWRIQVFGRWGSSAILGYIQDAPVKVGARLAEATARGLNLAQLKDQAAEQVPAVGDVPEWKITEAVLSILEGALSQDGRKSEEAGAVRLRRCLTKYLDIDASIDAHDNLPGEAYVQNRTAGIVHVVRSSTHTACGWAWATSTSAMLHAEADDADQLCAKCLQWSLGR